MNYSGHFTRRFMALVAVAAAALLVAPWSLADKLHLKDGTVLEGTITREEDTFLFFKYKIGSIEQDQFFSKDQVSKIEREHSTPAPGAKPEAAGEKDKKGEKKPKSLGSATRVAIINFGAPISWQGKIGDMVGLQVNAQSWRDAIPLLEKDNVDVVVVRVNSGGGMLLELSKFQELYQFEYKPKFRTVAWIESAISAAAMSPYVLEEMYFMPNGNLGACTGWYGNLQNVEGPQLEMVLAQMEKASDWGKRDPKIMRAMQIQVPLSATIDENTGEVTWYEDETSGEHLLNPKSKILTLTANDAVKFKFVRGIAATKEELAVAMGLQEVEWVGEEASAYVDKNMADCDKSDKTFGNAAYKFQVAFNLAAGLQDPKDRAAQVAIARRWLAEMRRLTVINPNFGLMRGMNEEWFREQERRLRELL